MNVPKAHPERDRSTAEDILRTQIQILYKRKKQVWLKILFAIEMKMDSLHPHHS